MKEKDVNFEIGYESIMILRGLNFNKSNIRLNPSTKGKTYFECYPYQLKLYFKVINQEFYTLSNVVEGRFNISSVEQFVKDGKPRYRIFTTLPFRMIDLNN